MYAHQLVRERIITDADLTAMTDKVVAKWAVPGHLRLLAQKEQMKRQSQGRRHLRDIDRLVDVSFSCGDPFFIVRLNLLS